MPPVRRDLDPMARQLGQITWTNKPERSSSCLQVLVVAGGGTLMGTTAPPVLGANHLHPRGGGQLSNRLGMLKGRLGKLIREHSG